MFEKIPNVETLETPEQRLNRYAPQIDEALQETADAVHVLEEARGRGEPIGGRAFDCRAKLYRLALELAPEARRGDIETMYGHISPSRGEIAADISAGTGFLTKPLASWTESTVYAIDPSEKQLDELKQSGDTEHIVTVRNWPDNEHLLDQIPEGSLDIVTSFGGIHHVIRPREMMENVARLLRPGGRFSAADVGYGSSLQKHFDEIVKFKCLTGHDMGRWMSPELLEELCEGLPLGVKEAEKRNDQTWDFNSEEEMAYFFKGLHAYPQSVEEVVHDLKDTLGVQSEEGKVRLNWPMLYFKIERT